MLLKFLTFLVPFVCKIHFWRLVSIAFFIYPVETFFLIIGGRQIYSPTSTDSVIRQSLYTLHMHFLKMDQITHVYYLLSFKIAIILYSHFDIQYKKKNSLSNTQDLNLPRNKLWKRIHFSCHFPLSSSNVDFLAKQLVCSTLKVYYISHRKRY